MIKKSKNCLMNYNEENIEDIVIEREMGTREMGTDLFKMHRKYAQQAHREGRRGATLFGSSSVAAAPHAGRYV